MPFQSSCARFGLSSSSAAFLPSSLSNLSAWFDAADSSTITGTTTVTQWNDKSGNGRNATNSSSTITRSTYNGQSVILFSNGSTRYMTTTVTVPLNAHTLIAIHVPTTVTSSSVGNTSLFRFQNVNYIVFPYMNGTTPRGYVTNQGGSGAGSIDAITSTLVENSVTTNFNIIVAAIASGNQLIFRNGTQQSSNTRTLSSSAASDPLWIGGFGNSESYLGSLGEMIVYSRQLTTTERQQVEGYLAWKWGVQTSLPTNHPYYNTRP